MDGESAAREKEVGDLLEEKLDELRRLEMALSSDSISGDQKPHVPPSEDAPTPWETSEAGEEEAAPVVRGGGAVGGGRGPARDRDGTQHTKLFIGGLAYATTKPSLKEFYQAFGEVVDCVVVTDAESGRSRGFGFVVFGALDSVDRAMAARPHIIDGRRVQAKRAMPKSMSGPEASLAVSKLYVRSWPALAEGPLRDFFAAFGTVTSVQAFPNRGYAFVNFNDYDPVDRVLIQNPTSIADSRVEIKKGLSKEDIDRLRQKSRDSNERGGLGRLDRGGRAGPGPTYRAPFNHSPRFNPYGHGAAAGSGGAAWSGGRAYGSAAGAQMGGAFTGGQGFPSYQPTHYQQGWGDSDPSAVSANFAQPITQPIPQPQATVHGQTGGQAGTYGQAPAAPGSYFTVGYGGAYGYGTSFTLNGGLGVGGYGDQRGSAAAVSMSQTEQCEAKPIAQQRGAAEFLASGPGAALGCTYTGSFSGNVAAAQPAPLLPQPPASLFGGSNASGAGYQPLSPTELLNDRAWSSPFPRPPNHL